MAYRKRGRNDANHAEAICEAVGRPHMRFVAIKSEEQQAVLMVHRARTLTEDPICKRSVLQGHHQKEAGHRRDCRSLLHLHIGLTRQDAPLLANAPLLA